MAVKIADGVERTTRRFLETLAAGDGPPMEALSPADAREVLVGAQAGADVPLPPADVADIAIVAAGRDIRLDIVRPKGSAGLLPAFLFFHGGGWVIGDFPTHERFVRDLVAASGAAAVFVNYTRSPEARHPQALDECFAALEWAAAQGASAGVDGARLAVAGNSAGGNLAAAVALKASQAGGPALRSQVLFWPVTDAGMDTGSYEQFKDGHFLTRNMMRWFWDHYIPDASDRGHGLASPLRASLEELAGLPPTLIQTAEFDVLRDEGEAYGRKLDAAGVDVAAFRVNGMIHDFGLLNALSGVPAVRAALNQAGESLKRALA